REVGKERLGAVPQRRVEAIELGEQQCARGVIRRDVVKDDQEQILVPPEVDEPSSQKNVAGQIEALACQTAEDAQALVLPPGFRAGAQIGDAQLDLGRRCDDLRRLSVDQAEGRASDL